METACSYCGTEPQCQKENQGLLCVKHTPSPATPERFDPGMGTEDGYVQIRQPSPATVDVPLPKMAAETMREQREDAAQATALAAFDDLHKSVDVGEARSMADRCERGGDADAMALSLGLAADILRSLASALETSEEKAATTRAQALADAADYIDGFEVLRLQDGLPTLDQIEMVLTLVAERVRTLDDTDDTEAAT